MREMITDYAVTQRDFFICCSNISLGDLHDINTYLIEMTGSWWYYLQRHREKSGEG